MSIQRILTEKQAAYVNERLELLAAYEALGTLEEVRAWKPEPAPLPLPLDEDIHVAAGLPGEHPGLQPGENPDATGRILNSTGLAIQPH